MALKFIGGTGLALGALLLFIALAQPATVPDSTTTCVDSTYFGHDCATMSYERPNYGRSSLMGGAIFLIFSGLFTYGIGAALSSEEESESPPVPRDDLGGRTESASQQDPNRWTLREQLEARKAEREAGTARIDDRISNEPSARDFALVTDAVEGAVTGPAGRDSVEDITSTETEQFDGNTGLPTTVPVTLSALASSFVLSALLSTITTVESLGVRALLFALLSVPGTLAYWWYTSQRAGPDTDSTEVVN